MNVRISFFCNASYSCQNITLKTKERQCHGGAKVIQRHLMGNLSLLKFIRMYQLKYLSLGQSDGPTEHHGDG